MLQRLDDEETYKINSSNEKDDLIASISTCQKGVKKIQYLSGEFLKRDKLIFMDFEFLEYNLA